MITTSTLFIWLISLISCGVLSYFAGRGSMRIIEIKSNETIREIPKDKNYITELYKNFYGEEEEAFVPGVDDTEEAEARNIIYKTFDGFDNM